MAFVISSTVQTLRQHLVISRANSALNVNANANADASSTMPSSERTPLLSGSVNGPGLPSRRDIENALPSKESRIKVSQVLGALDAGKFPSQEQISRMLQLVIESDTLKAAGGAASRTARLGPEGHRVLENFKQVLRAFKAWGEEKNGDDLIQNFFYNATNADVDVDVNLPNTPSEKELSKDAQRAISSFRTIASLMVTNENFRQLVSDGIILSRDILADTAAEAADRAKKVADKSRPSEEERQKGVDFEHLGKKGKETAKHVASGKTKAEAKESLWEEVEGVREYFDEKLPDADEAKDQVIQRLQKIVKQAQENPEYRRSLKALIGLFKKYAHKAEEALDEAKAKSNVDDEDEKVQQAGRDLKAFIEKLANKSLDDVISTAQAAAKDVRDNDKLSKYFEELENYVDRLLFDPGYVVSQKAYRKASSLYDDGQSLLRENDQWKKDAAALQKELEALADGIANDSATNRLVQSIENLGDSIATAGKVGFNALSVEGVGLYRDITDVLVPRLISLVKEIPVPRLEYKSEDFDLVIDDINLESTSFIPDSVRFVQHNDLRFTQGYATYASEYDATARLRVEGFHFQASNIAFWVNKKTGFMPFEDSGILDVQFGPKGISFDVELENADPDDRETFFTVKKVEVWMEGFDFQVSKNHKWFATWFAKPILRAFVKRNLTSALEVQIQEYLKTADFRLFALQQRAIAATNARPSPVNFVRAVFSDSIFPQSFGRSTTEVKPKGVVKYGRHGEYILHIGVDEDLFPNQPPAEISNKARLKLKAKAAQMKREAKRATGAADEFADGAKKQAKDVAGKAKQEANEMSARAREAKRREERTEGWRSDAFDV